MNPTQSLAAEETTLQMLQLAMHLLFLIATGLGQFTVTDALAPHFKYSLRGPSFRHEIDF